jgi:transcriptional regulator with XRE-family HTH domain
LAHMPDGLPPSEFLPDRIESVRRRREWTQQDLADAMKAIGNGVKINRSTIAKIESGKRAVTVDEVFWFAAALGVSPLALVLPRGDQPVRVAPGADVSSSSAIRWFRGLVPLLLLGNGERRDDRGHDDVRFFDEQRPDYEVRAERRLPGLLHLMDDAALVVSLVGDGDPGKDTAAGVAPDQAADYFLRRVAEEALALQQKLIEVAKRERARRTAARREATS